MQKSVGSINGSSTRESDDVNFRDSVSDCRDDSVTMVMTVVARL